MREVKSILTLGDALLITWSDGAVHRLKWVKLRDACPCATCREKRSEPSPLLPVLAPQETVAIAAKSMRPIGNYAYRCNFSDGHNTGLYTLELLHSLCEQTSAREDSPSD